MKTLTKLFVAVVLLFTNFACTTDATEDLGVQIGNGGGQTEITLSLEGTKTHLGEKSGEGYPLYWSEGDKIAVNGVASQALAAEADGKTTASFTVAGVSYPYNIVYPAPVTTLDVTLEGARATEGAQRVTFLAEQPYKVGSFAEGAAPLYAQVAAEGDKIELKHLSGVLCFAPKGEGVVLTSMTVTSETGKIAGDFDVDCATGALTAREEATNVVTVSFGEGLALGAEATPIYVAVPAGEYGEFEVILNTATDKMVVKFNSNGEKKIKAGVVREFKEFTYAASPAEGEEFLITTKEDLISFAAKASTTKSVKLAATIDMTDEAWTPIEGFVGTFDGDNFEIKGLTAPLFGTVSGTIKNLKLTDVNIVVTANHYYAVQTEEGAVQKPVVYSGAIAYHLAGGSLTGCYTSGKVEVNNKVFNVASDAIVGDYFDVCLGGMVGLVQQGKVSNCENHIDLTISSVWKNDHTTGFSVKTGAMIGMVADSSEISSCDNYGDIICNLTHAKSKNVHMGTLLGGSNADNALKVFTDCTNYGNFTVPATASRQGIYYVGGVAGYLNKGITEFKNITNLGCGELLGAGNGQEYRVGGIAGAINSESDNLVNGSKDDASKGCVRISCDEAGKNGNVYLAGMAYSSIAGLSNAKNYGKLTIEGYAANTYLAGILGTNASASFTNCENHGTLVHNLTVTAVTNIGGILAQAYIAADNTRDVPFNITGCKNTGNIVYNVASGAAHTGLRVIGGIYGYGNLKNELIASTIDGCESSGIMTVVDKASKDLELAFGAIHGYTQYGKGVTILNTKSTTKMYVGYDVNLETGVATPIEGHVFGGKMKAAGFHAMYTRATTCTNCDFAGEINIHGKFTKNDQIQIGGYGGYGTGMWTLTNCKFSGKIHLSDQTIFASSASKSLFVGGYLAYPANDNAENNQVFTNCSTTKSASITIGAQHTKGDIYVGGFLAYTAKKAIMTFNGCHSHATITLTKAASSTEDVCVGGLIGWRGGSNAIPLKGCYNDGNITVEGVSFNKLYVGGVVAGTASVSMAEDSAYPYCYNAGAITVGNTTGNPLTVKEIAAVGGYFGYTTSTQAFNANIGNKGNITVSKVSVPTLYVGGVWGYMNGAAKVASTSVYTNIGKITVDNVTSTAATSFVGGIIGGTLCTINGAQSYCDIAVQNGISVGWIMGTHRTTDIKATNCAVGGRTQKWDVEGEVYLPSTIPSDEYFNYIYGGREGTDWTGTDNYDGSVHLPSAPTIVEAPTVK